MTVAVDFANIFESYHKRIYSYIFLRTSDPDVAEDLTADVFMRAIDATERGFGVRENVSSWLYRIAHNRVIDHYKVRDHLRLVTLDEISEMPCDHRPEDVFEQHVIREAIEQAALKTTPEQYEVVMAWMT